MLTLIDGNSLLFRAYYGVHGNLTRSDGMPIGAVYGFFNMLLPVLADAKQNDSFVCVFDASRITFRQDIYPQYKANRTETPADLLTQGELIRIGVRAMGIPVLCIPNVEADDVIATISTANCNNDGGTRIITGDKDLMQLVSHCVFLYDGMKQKEIHEHEVIEKFGVEPDKVIEVQSLMGDTSDNVPGVHGIGPKTATSLIQQFGTLENLYNNLDKVKNERIRNLLQEYKTDAFISKQLVTLKTDVNLDGLTIQPFVFNTTEALNFVIQKIESNSLYTKIQKLFPSTANIETPVVDYDKSVCPVIDIPESITKNKLNNINYHSIITEQQLKNFLADVKNIIAFDTETTGLNQNESKLVGISLAIDEQNGVYIPLRHKTKTMDLFGTESFVPGQLSIDTVFKYLSPIFANNDITKVAHNLKYDLHILENEGFDTSVIQNFDDTMLLSYILHGTLHNHSLDELALKYLGYTTIKYTDLFDKSVKDENRLFENIDIDTATKYSGEDSVVCLALYNLMRPQLNKNKQLQNLYETCDLPLCPILMNMEKQGISVNKNNLQSLSNTFHLQLKQLEQEIYNIVGHEFNIGSPKQLASVLFEELHLSSNTKKHSTDADTLNDLIDKHPIIEKILNWRSISKLATTYTDSLPKQIAKDGKIHTTYIQTSTNTGRLSSREPNLQNIPVKTELGEEIRKCFIADDGYEFISVDYSQIQLRLLADIANVSIFKDTFNKNQDIHEQTARKIFNISPEQTVPAHLRRAAKTVNFSIIYGISPWGLSAQLGITKDEAKNIIQSYMDSIPEIYDYIERTKQFALDNAFVLTPWGRRIELPDVKIPRLKTYALRAAINAPVQGFEADLMRKVMVDIYHKVIQKNKDKIRMILQVHDEIIFECKTEYTEQFASQIKNIMETIVKLSVPLVAEVNINKLWSK